MTQFGKKVRPDGPFRHPLPRARVRRSGPFTPCQANHHIAHGGRPLFSPDSKRVSTLFSIFVVKHLLPPSPPDYFHIPIYEALVRGISHPAVTGGPWPSSPFARREDTFFSPFLKSRSCLSHSARDQMPPPAASQKSPARSPSLSEVF